VGRGDRRQRRRIAGRRRQQVAPRGCVLYILNFNRCDLVEIDGFRGKSNGVWGYERRRGALERPGLLGFVCGVNLGGFWCRGEYLNCGPRLVLVFGIRV